MIIVWRGFGFLVLFTGIAGVFLTHLLLGWITRDPLFTDTHPWTKLAAGALAGALTYLLALGLDRYRNGRAAKENPEAEWVDLTGVDTLFWIPVKYWAVIFLVIGIVAAFLR